MAKATRIRIDGDGRNNVITGQLNAVNVIYGLAGDDRLTGGNLGDVLVGGSGRDTIDGGASIDGLWGGGGNDLLLGGAGNDRLVGDGDRDTLDGGTGYDLLEGGSGDDTYIVDSVSDRIVELAGKGNDTVIATFSYTLSSTVEHLVLRGSGNTVARGNSGNNSLSGNAGANVIDGGAGNDVMAGGAGNDTYYLDTTGDRVTENVNEGVDTIHAGFSLVMMSNVENFVMTGAGNTTADGNALANEITGTSGNNLIYGRDGTDTLWGNGGNDTVWGGEGRDTLSGGDGHDIVSGGAREDNVWGSTGNDTIFGGGENDSLNAGDGNDRIAGDGGNDIIRGGAGGDVMTGGQMDGSVPKGANTFTWDRADVVTGSGASAGFDTITDFGAGDRLNLAGVLTGHPSDLTGLVRVSDGAAGTTIAVNIGGTYMNVVQLSGIHEVSLASFLSHYDIIV